MPVLIEVSPWLHRRLDALPPPVQPSVWRALQRANDRLASHLAQAEHRAAHLQQQAQRGQAVLQAVAQVWGLRAPQLTGAARVSHLVLARRQAAYVLVRQLRWRPSQVARLLRRHPAHILRMQRTHVAALHRDASYAARYLQLTALLEAQGLVVPHVNR